jgi:hypothetical protein
MVAYFPKYLIEECYTTCTFRKWNVKKLTWEEDTEPYALARDQKIKDIAQVGAFN